MNIFCVLYKTSWNFVYTYQGNFRIFCYNKFAKSSSTFVNCCESVWAIIILYRENCKHEWTSNSSSRQISSELLQSVLKQLYDFLRKWDAGGVLLLILRVGKLVPRRLCRLIMYLVGDLRIETYQERNSVFMNIACSETREAKLPTRNRHWLFKLIFNGGWDQVQGSRHNVDKFSGLMLPDGYCKLWISVFERLFRMKNSRARMGVKFLLLNSL